MESNSFPRSLSVCQPVRMATVRRWDDGRVVLRDIADTDGDAIYERLSTDRDIARWTRIPWPYTRGHLHDFMALVGRTRIGESDIVLAICEPGDDRLLGCIGVHRIGARAVPRSAMLPDEIGYWIAQEARGRGLTTHARCSCSRPTRSASWASSASTCRPRSATLRPSTLRATPATATCAASWLARSTTTRTTTTAS